MSAPTMLPTMRYDPDRAVVWVWPDRDAPFLVTRHAIEDLTESRGPISGRVDRRLRGARGVLRPSHSPQARPA